MTAPHPLARHEFDTPLPRDEVKARLRALVTRKKGKKTRYSGELVDNDFRLFRFTGLLYPYTPLFTGQVRDQVQEEGDDHSKSKRGSVVTLNVLPPWLGHGTMLLLLVIYLLAVSPGTAQGNAFGGLLILLIAGLMMRFRARQIRSVFADIESALTKP